MTNRLLNVPQKQSGALVPVVVCLVLSLLPFLNYQHLMCGWSPRRLWLTFEAVFSQPQTSVVCSAKECVTKSPLRIYSYPPAHLPTGINIRNGMVDILFYRPTHKEGSCLRIITRQTHIWRHWRKQKITKVSFKGKNEEITKKGPTVVVMGGMAMKGCRDVWLLLSGIHLFTLIQLTFPKHVFFGVRENNTNLYTHLPKDKRTYTH